MAFPPDSYSALAEEEMAQQRQFDDRIMSPIEFKAGMMRLARSEPTSLYDVFKAWRLVFTYMDADDDAKRDCSEMLRQDLKVLDTDEKGQSDG